MEEKKFPPSRVPRYNFADTLKAQEEQLKTDPLMLRMIEARAEKADNPYRPIYHYVNPENKLNILRSPHKGEFTRICFYNRRGNKYRVPFPNDPRANRMLSTAISTPVSHESIVSIDTSHSSILPDVLVRPPESAPVDLGTEENLELQIFVDRSVVEVFVNKRQCLSVRVYPGRTDSVGVSLLSRNQASRLISLDCWQMQNIYQ